MEAADLNLENRPGVPRERPEAPAGNARYTAIPRQQGRSPTLMHTGRKEMTPVFGDSPPPRGLSGVIRRKAYAIPEHFPAHTLMLMMADRVDVLEHTLLPKLPAAAAVLLAGTVLLRKLR